MTDLIKDASASHFSRLIVRKVGSNNDLDYIDFDYLIAADGANSFIRNKIGISLKGKAEMQTLLNVHFSCPGLRELLHPRPAMLYFVFNEVEKIENHFLKQTILIYCFQRAVAVFVSHDVSRDEWVCQIPYFPPYQSQEVDELFQPS